MLKLPVDERSLWREAYTESLYPQLTADIQTDAVIIGAGITGLTTAYLLKQAGLTVAVLEKATVGGGTSGRTTGKLTSQHGLIYSTLQQRLGTDVAQSYADANQAAVAKVASIIQAENIDCSFERADNYVFTTDATQVTKFQQEAKICQQLGLPASYETTSPLPFQIQAAVRFTDQANFDAQQYLLGLAAAIHGNGSYVFEHSNVTRIKDGQPCRVKTANGSVTASDIIVATNVPTLPLTARGSYCIVEYPQESYIVAGRLSGEVTGMYISPDKANYSVLPVTVNGERLLLVGGEGHISGLRGSTKRRYQRLATYAHEQFGVTEITHRWSDRDYLAYDDLPLIGKLYPRSEHLYVASAFRKWGLSNGTAAAMILHDLIIGQENPWAATFQPHRHSAVASIPRVIGQHLTGNS